MGRSAKANRSGHRNMKLRLATHPAMGNRSCCRDHDSLSRFSHGSVASVGLNNLLMVRPSSKTAVFHLLTRGDENRDRSKPWRWHGHHCAAPTPPPPDASLSRCSVLLPLPSPQTPLRLQPRAAELKPIVWDKRPCQPCPAPPKDLLAERRRLLVGVADQRLTRRLSATGLTDLQAVVVPHWQIVSVGCPRRPASPKARCLPRRSLPRQSSLSLPNTWPL